MARRGLRSKAKNSPWARRRMRAANLCTTSFHAAWIALVAVFIPFLGNLAFLAAVVAVAFGVMGLLMMLSLKATSGGHEPGTAHERVAARVGQRAMGMVCVGIGFGVLVLVLLLSPFSPWR